MADVLVTIDGNSQPLKAATNDAVSSLKTLQNQLDQSSNSAKGMGGSFDFVQSALGTLGTALAMFAANIATQVFDQLISKVEEFGQSMLKVSVDTEANAYKWQYLYGGGIKGTGKQDSQSLLDWSRQFSLSIPYTRQDLLAAITTLGAKGMSVSDTEKTLREIADISSTQGRPGLTLQWATRAVQEAMLGQSRMLKMDLNINPNDLEKYGYDSSNKDSLLPALQAYSDARGLTGASKGIATETMWGAWSSFIDRIQNFQLDTGKGGFAELKKTLNDLTDWWDSHQTQVQAMASMIGGGLSTAILGIRDAITQFAEGWQSGGGSTFFAAIGGLAQTSVTDGLAAISGFGKGLSDSHVDATFTALINNIDKVLGKKEVRDGIKAVSDMAGMVVGKTFEEFGNKLNYIGTQFEHLQKTAIFKTLNGTIKDLKKSFDDFGKALNDTFGKDTMKKLTDFLGLIVLIGASVAILTIIGALGILTLVLNLLSLAIQKFGDFWRTYMDPIFNTIGGWIKTLGDFIAKLGELKDKLSGFSPGAIGGDIGKFFGQSYQTNQNTTSNATLNFYGTMPNQVQTQVVTALQTNNANSNTQARQAGGYIPRGGIY